MKKILVVIIAALSFTNLYAEKICSIAEGGVWLNTFTDTKYGWGWAADASYAAGGMGSLNASSPATWRVKRIDGGTPRVFSGIHKCSSDYSSDKVPTAADGAHCYCQRTKIDADASVGRWQYQYRFGNGSICAERCADYCQRSQGVYLPKLKETLSSIQ